MFKLKQFITVKDTLPLIPLEILVPRMSRLSWAELPLIPPIPLFLWGCNFLFTHFLYTPKFSGTQQGHKTSYIYHHYSDIGYGLLSNTTQTDLHKERASINICK